MREVVSQHTQPDVNREADIIYIRDNNQHMDIWSKIVAWFLKIQFHSNNTVFY